MSKKTNKVLILRALQEHYGFKKKSEFARFLGIVPTTLASWELRNTLDFEIIYNKCKDINPDWLLGQKGEMLRKNVSTELSMVAEPSEQYNKKDREEITEILHIVQKLQSEIEQLRDLKNPKKRTSA